MVAFVFGLVHGFGFAWCWPTWACRRRAGAGAGGLQLGVEIGQLAIVLAVLPLAFLLRHTRLYRQAFMPAGSIAIGVAASCWLVARLSGASLG